MKKTTTPPAAVAQVEAVKARVFLGIGAAFVVFCLMLWYAMDVFLLIFASILMAVFLRRLACWVHAKTGWKNGLCLTVVLVSLGLILTAAAWLLVPEISEQMDSLSEQIPQSWAKIRAQLEHWPWIKKILSSAIAPSEGGKAAVSAIPVVISGGGELIGAGIFILFGGVFLAWEPGVYIDNFVRLFPIPKRERVRAILLAIGDALAGWLVGQIILMFVVGSLTTLGLWLLKMPMALTLGLLTALLLFVPYTGSVASAVPAILIALMQSAHFAFYIVLLYVATHIVEGYVVGPIIQKKVLKLPPALTLSFQLLMGVLGGIPGLALSTPTVAMLVVLVRMAYVESVLGDTSRS